MSDEERDIEHGGAGDGIRAGNARWSFGGAVPGAFEDHIGKSVPGYREGHDMVAQLSDFFVRDGSLVYEIGCSTGALCRRLAEHNEAKSPRIVGLEVEPDVARVARERCAEHPTIAIEETDALGYPFEPCDMIVSYYTMQFIRPAMRQALFDRIYEALHWGGAFVMFEKVRGPDARFQDILTALYNDFKLANGYDEREIVAKTRSLKGVLEPFSTQGNMDMMARAGFQDRMSVFKHLCFEGFLAIK